VTVENQSRASLINFFQDRYVLKKESIWIYSKRQDKKGNISENSKKIVAYI
jgi:hypothetical protein